MATIASLIRHLKEYDPNEPVIFQFAVAEHTDLDPDRFEDVAEYLMDNDSFGEESINFFHSWIAEAQDVLDEWDTREEED